MREIKFRAKVLDRPNQWVYGQYFVTPLTDENSNEPIESGMYFLSSPAKPHHCIVQNSVAFCIDINTLGQYINKKDKNGKEIYENDNLATSNDDPDFDIWTKEDYGITTVIWSEEEDRWSGSEWVWETDEESVFDLRFIEVVSNIYD